MKTNHLYLFFIFFTILLSCTSQTDEQDPVTSFKSVAKGGQIVEANNTFAFSLFKEIAMTETKNNFMISPVSASLAMGMVYNGAAGKTQQAFADVFDYGDATLEQTNLVNQNIIDNLTYGTSGSTFEVANSLWVNHNFPIKESFVALNQKYYYAAVENRDFKDPATLNAINHWASSNTNGKIPEILDEISDNAVLYAINALYFKSDWKYKFDPDDNQSLPFHSEDGTVKNVAMMSMEQDLPYFSNELFAAARLPYKNDKYSMTLLLPHGGKTTKDVVALMSSENWNQWQDDYAEKGIKLTMPKFTFSYEKKFNEALINLGLSNAFSEGVADFSKMTDMEVFISFVLQKTFIEVNEKGSEAAAVTAVGIELTSVGGGTPHLFLDRPFLFVITEKDTGSICFIGKVGQPQYNQ